MDTQVFVFQFGCDRKHRSPHNAFKPDFEKLNALLLKTTVEEKPVSHAIFDALSGQEIGGPELAFLASLGLVTVMESYKVFAIDMSKPLTEEMRRELKSLPPQVFDGLPDKIKEMLLGEQDNG